MKLSDCTPAEQSALTPLEARIGRVHFRQRLGLEGDHEARVVRTGTHFFHLENWYSVHGFIRGALWVMGLLRRGQRNALRIPVHTQDVAFESLPRAFDGFTLLHLSDLHLDSSENYVDHLIQSIRGLPFDLCVLTGDFRFRTFGPYLPALNALARLRPHLGEHVFAVLGNHDTIRMVPGMEALGVRVLMNESEMIDRSGERIALAGIDDAHYFCTHNFHKALGDLPHDLFTILLSHTPEPYRHAAHANVALMLCGHTHGGQICLPGGIPIITDSDAPRTVARGLWRHATLTGYTSVGCGSSIVNVRLNCPAEATLLRLCTGNISVA